jgi:hypothetical protein
MSKGWIRTCINAKDLPREPALAPGCTDTTRKARRRDLRTASRQPTRENHGTRPGRALQAEGEGKKTPTMRQSIFSFSVVLPLALSAGCGVPPPDRIDIVAPGTLHFEETGKTMPLSVRAFRGVKEHDYEHAPLTVTWSSSDPSVVTVDGKGVVTATGSGRAQVNASVPGGNDTTLAATVPVENVMVSTVEAKGDFPNKFSLTSPPVTLAVVVRDEKGDAVASPRVKYRATDYCVDVSPDGVVRPLAVGECSVVVEIAGKTAKIDLDVKE